MPFKMKDSLRSLLKNRYRIPVRGTGKLLPDVPWKLAFSHIVNSFFDVR